ncbi:hypothetical protein M9H77_08012 [Catharanthus roseus]|uniref:Uncharacterized protein n=1 Tax=Catharanthus roseus TaxID=4058 RepID=A0ACC0BWI4_CATRO|nr:hypothetical protein M9H77_08012 [Catharanthus roseus]
MLNINSRAIFVEENQTANPYKITPDLQILARFVSFNQFADFSRFSLKILCLRRYGFSNLLCHILFWVVAARSPVKNFPASPSSTTSMSSYNGGFQRPFEEKKEAGKGSRRQLGVRDFEKELWYTVLFCLKESEFSTLSFKGGLNLRIGYAHYNQHTSFFSSSKKIDLFCELLFFCFSEEIIHACFGCLEIDRGARAAPWFRPCVREIIRCNSRKFLYVAS